MEHIGKAAPGFEGGRGAGAVDGREEIGRATEVPDGGGPISAAGKRTAEGEAELRLDAPVPECLFVELRARLPDGIAKLQARIMERLPGKAFTMDNYRSLTVPSLCTSDGLDALGIRPQALSVSLPEVLGMPREQVELNTGSTQIRSAFTHLARERRSELVRTLRGARVDLLELSTDGDFLPPLMAFFNRRERRLAR